MVDEAGKLRSGRKVIDAPPEGEGYGLTFAIPVAPGPYRLRFAVADASGRVGAVEKAVRAELAPMGPFAVGDLQTAWLDADEKEQADFPPADDLPPAAKTLSVSLELFQLAGGSRHHREGHVRDDRADRGAVERQRNLARGSAVRSIG